MRTSRYGDFVLLRRLFRQARPFWAHILGLLLLSLVATPITLLSPLPLKIAVDSVLGNHPLPASFARLFPAAWVNSTPAVLVLSAVLVVVIALLYQLQTLASWLLQTYTGEKLVMDFRARLFGHVQRLSLIYHDTRGTTDSTYRIQYDALSIQNVTNNGIIPFVGSTFTLAGMMFVTAKLDPLLALIAVAICPVLFIFVQTSRRRLRRRWSELKELQSHAMSVVQEALSSIRVVKAFGQEEHEHRRFLGHTSKTIQKQLSLALVEGGFDVLVSLTLAIGTAAAMFVGVLHVQAGTLTLGGLLMAMTYMAQLYQPLQSISKRVNQLQSSLASAERAFALLDEPSDVAERAHARHLGRAQGTVAFENVSFAYTHEQPVLRDITFAIEPGTRLGIAGTTGAGKTTLVSLLTRFYDPTRGRILLDGVDLRDYKLSDLRNQFAIVLQEPVLFSTSIAENIAYARPEAGLAELVEAARAANAHDFITRLQRGYETLVGERGMRLSGGERQRISLARAFLKDAPILILDEPTSSIDTRTETAIMEAMERLMRDRTTIMIAHRLSTLSNCDDRLQIEDGRLVGQVRGREQVAG